MATERDNGVAADSAAAGSLEWFVEQYLLGVEVSMAAEIEAELRALLGDGWSAPKRGVGSLLGELEAMLRWERAQSER